MAGKRMLDTNIVVALFRGRPEILRKVDTTEIFVISNIVLGELYYGALNSIRKDDELDQIRNLMAKSRMLSCGFQTSWRYGEIKRDLRLKGRLIPENDIWIAAL